MIAPDAEMPETAILDFIVAISVLPMATFTTISVLGGSQTMPDWMFEQEEKLESLRTKELGEGGVPDVEKSGALQSGEEDVLGTNVEEPQVDGGMIDMPFELFADD